jgi:hypothetical protein
MMIHWSRNIYEWIRYVGEKKKVVARIGSTLIRYPCRPVETGISSRRRFKYTYAIKKRLLLKGHYKRKKTSKQANKHVLSSEIVYLGSC